MIKVHYKDFVVEVETITEARLLMGGHVVSDKTSEPKVTRKYKKHHRSNKWTSDEVNVIVSYLKNGDKPRHIAKNDMLRARHSKTAIKQMAFQVAKGKLENFSDVVRSIVSDYRELGRNVPIRTA